MEIIDQKIREFTDLLEQMREQQNKLLSGDINGDEKSIFYSNAEKAQNLVKSIKKEFQGKNSIEYQQKLKQIEPYFSSADILIDTMKQQFKEIEEQNEALGKIENQVEPPKEIPAKKVEPLPKNKKKCLIMQI